MTSTWSEHPEAREELRAAVRYYEDREDYLGDRLGTAVESAVESLLDPSFQWGYYRSRRSVPQIYSRSVAGFPFDVIYIFRDRRVVVLAYAHERRLPGYWMPRLND